MPASVQSGIRVHRAQWTIKPVWLMAVAATLLLVLAVGVSTSIGDADLSRVTLYCLAAVGAVLVFRLPWLLLAFVLLAEQIPSGSTVLRQLPAAVTLGHQVFSIARSGVPVVVGLAVVASAGAITRLSPQARSWLFSPTSTAAPFVGLQLIGATTYSAVFILENRSFSYQALVAGAVGASSLFLLLATGFICTLFLYDQGLFRVAESVLAVVVIGKALLAVITWLDTGGAVIDGQGGVVYYDLATPLLGAGVLACWSFGVQFQGWKGKLLLAGAAVCVISSFRITVFLAAVVLVAVGSLLSRNYRRPASIIALMILVYLLAPPFSVLSGAIERISSLGALGGSSSSAGTSAASHVDDVRVGLQIALSNPIAGLGTNAPQPSELAAYASPTVYVHNEYLQQWLRFGLLGLLILLALVVCLFFLGRRVLALPEISPREFFAASVCAIVWVPLLSAPYLSTSQRLPLVVGGLAAIGCLGLADSTSRRQGRANEPAA